MLASPMLGRAWRLFGIGGDGHPPASPVALPTGRLLRTALRAARSMDGSSLSAFGIARISAAQAAEVFAGPHRGGFLIVDAASSAIHREGGRAAAGSRGRRSSTARPASGAPRAFAALQPPHDPQRPQPGIRVDWLGIPVV